MKEAAASVKKQAFSSPPLAAQCVRLSGSRALGDTISSIVAQRQPEEVTLLVFDFDKTLTNGHASPTSSLEQRVRGGTHTIEALRKTLATPGILRKVLTARPPTKSSVESVVLQLIGSMQLGEFFATEASAEECAPFEYGSCGAMIVLDTCTVAAAIANTKVEQRACPPIRVHFFDDSVSNAYRVSSETVLATGAVPGMVGALPPQWDVQLTVYWWDLYV